MRQRPVVNFSLSGLSLTEFGLSIPSPFASLELTNSEIASYTNWTLKLTVGGDYNKQVNIAAFEALIYSAAQADGYAKASGIPVAFMFGWLDARGNVDTYLSYQGYTLNYSTQTSGRFITYTLTGYASQAIKASMPVLHIPSLCGYVQPSAVVEGLAKAIKADTFYELDIDHCDSPTLVEHNAMTTSFISYVRGNMSSADDYDTFPGLVKLAKTYNSTRDAAGIVTKKAKKLSTLMNNLTVSPLKNYMKKSITDNTPQMNSFAFWIDEPTMTRPGTIHFKNAGSLMTTRNSAALQYGTADSNILAISASYKGVAYNITDMKFATLGFTLDESGNVIVNDAQVVNSWSNSVASVYQSANIINDINALATQFSGSISVTIAGSTKGYSIAEPVPLVIMSGNTLSPISGIYSIMSVTHTISTTFLTTLKLQRLAISSANQVAAGNGIMMRNSTNVASGYTQTNNIKSPYKVDFGTLYPTWEDIQTL